MTAEIVIAALYQFTPVEDPEALKASLLTFCRDQHIKGTLILAKEGINGTVAGTRANIDLLVDFLRQQLQLDNVEYKEAIFEEQPFYRMKVKVKQEIVTLGVDDIDPNKAVGEYVDPENWNDLINDPTVTVIDTRNHYEYTIGSFKGALDPDTESFREFPEYVDQTLDPKVNKKVAMFCTGGIRCEKATALMLAKGFEEVYHLKGGILNYLEKVPEDKSLWEGECFVFDNRVAVGHALAPGSYDLCHGCRMPISEDDKQSKDYVEGVSCPHCANQLTDDQKQRFAERQKQVQLAKARKEQHIGSKD